MATRIAGLCAAALIPFALAFSPVTTRAEDPGQQMFENGIVRVKSAYPFDETIDRIKAAVDARTDSSFVVMARTDALANEGLDQALDRARRYVEAGADMLFPEAITDLRERATVA